MDAICSASTRYVRAVASGAAAEAGQERDREQRRREDRQQRAQPRHRPRPAQSSPEGGDARVQRAERGHDQQHRDRRRGVEERAPRRRHREQQARREEGQHGHEQDGPQGPIAALPGQGEQADQGHRDAQEQQDVEQVVAEARDAHLEQAAGSGREIAGERRRVVPREDVEPAQRQRVRGRLAGEGVAEHGPVAEGPRREHEQAHDGDDADQAEPDTPRVVPLHAPGQPRPGQGEPDGLVARQRREADEQADPEEAGVQHPGLPRLAQDARHQQRRAEDEGAEQHRGVGQRGVEQQRQVDRRREPGPGCERSSPPGRQAALQGDVRGEAPGEDGHDRAGDDRDRPGPRASPSRAGSDAARPPGPSGWPRAATAAAARPRTRAAGTRAAACRSSTARPTRGPRPSTRLRATPT